MERKLTIAEKEEVFSTFREVGERMQLKNLPANYNDWLIMREHHLNNDMAYSIYTADLYKQYKKHLGMLRYFLLKQAQVLVVPEQVKKLLKLGNTSVLSFIIFFYKISRSFKLDWFLKSLVLPAEYKARIKALDNSNA